MNEHTPGPWSKECLAIGAKRDRISISDANGRTLLNMSVYDESDAANVCLIVAAPDLLAALRDVLPLAAQMNAATGVWNAKIDAARAAIAKATGVQR